MCFIRFHFPSAHFCFIFNYVQVVSHNEADRLHNLPPVCHVPRYTEEASSIQQKETVLNIRFVTLDCSPIKSSLAQLYSEWQNGFTQLLSHMASTHLKELHVSLHDNANRWALRGDEAERRKGKGAHFDALNI